MKTTILSAIIFIFSCATAKAADPWSDQDKALEAVFVAVTVIDWRQTVYIAGHPEKYTEQNPLLGQHPSDSQVNTYMAASILTHIAVTHVLPARLRPYWQMSWIAIESVAVTHNARVGVRIGF